MAFIRVDIASLNQLIPNATLIHRLISDVSLLLPGWKYLPRCEPALSTLDEKKQLRCFTQGNSPFYTSFEEKRIRWHCMKLNQRGDMSEDDLIPLAKAVKMVFERELRPLGYAIGVIVMTETHIV